MNFRQEKHKNKVRWRERALNDPLYQNAIFLRDRFLECELNLSNPKGWKILNDYIIFKEGGCATKGQEKKVQEIFVNFGPYSLFYQEYLRTIRLRERWRERVFYVCRAIDRSKEIKTYGRIQSQLSRFKLAAVDFVQRLRSFELTYKQKCYLWKIEHMLGIWWDDLSDEENGLIERIKEE